MSAAFLPFALKDFGGRAGHEDAVGGVVPVDAKIAAGEVERGAAGEALGEDAGDEDGAGPGAAGLGDAAAALPGSHRGLAAGVDGDEVDIGTIGEGAVAFESWSDSGQVEPAERRGIVIVLLLERVLKDDGVRVSHRDECGGETGVDCFEADVEAVVPGNFALAEAQPFAVEDGLAHVDGGFGEFSAASGVGDFECAAAGLDPHGVLADSQAIVGELCDASDAVAAHLRLGSVGVEHAHADVGVSSCGADGLADEDEAVTADTPMAVAHGPGKGR